MIATRRSFLGFLAAAPFVVKASSLMPVRALLADDGVALTSIPYPGSYASFLDEMIAGIKRYEISYGSLPPQWDRIFAAARGAS